MLRPIFIAIAISNASLLAQPPSYLFRDLGVLGGDRFTGTEVTGINIRGQVIGYETLPGGRIRSFRTAPNTPINWATDDLGSLGGAATKAFDINASGQVVGGSTLSTGEFRGFRTAANKSIQAATDNVGTLSGQTTVAIGINDAGQVTGNSGDRAFVTAPNAAIDPSTDDIDFTLSDRQTQGTQGYRINNRGHVLGHLIVLPANYMAFLQTPRIRTVLPSDIRLYIQRRFTGPTEEDQIAFNLGDELSLWQDGRGRVLAKCATWCVPVSINNSLQIVGSSTPNPFLYTNGILYDLTTLIRSSPAMDLWFSLYINDLGQIAGTATIDNETHAIRLDPVDSVPSAIHQTLNMVRSLPLDRRIRGTFPLMLKAGLAAKLSAALDSWNGGNPAATRGLLNEFENIVRSHTGKSLSQERADQMLEMAEAAIALT